VFCVFVRHCRIGCLLIKSRHAIRFTEMSPKAMLDKDAFHLENALLKLIEALERKRDDGTWTDNPLLHDLELLYEGSSESG
jgi:hypothetical protein